LKISTDRRAAANPEPAMPAPAALAAAQARIAALEAALADSAAKTVAFERLTRALGASGMIGVWDGDLVNGVVYTDENLARIYGIDPAMGIAGLPSRHHFQYVHPEDRPAMAATFDALLAEGTEFASEHRIVRPDGAQRWVLARGRMSRAEDGAPLRLTGVSIDITARKTEEMLQAFLLALQDRLRGLSDPDAILHAAAEALGTRLGANRIGFGRVHEDGRQISVMCGYARDAARIEGVFALDTFGRENLDRLRAGQTVVHDDVLADGDDARATWARIGTRAHVSVPMTRDGVYRGTLFVSFLEPHAWTEDEIGLIEAVAGRLWEAAERARAEQTLRDAEERTRIALAAGGLGTWEIDLVSGQTRRSTRHDEIFGYAEPPALWSVEMFLGYVVPADRERVAARLREAAAGPMALHEEFRILAADGTEKWVNVRAQRVAGDGRPARLMGIIADISARKADEARLVASEKMFRSFAQAMPHHVWSAGPDGEIDWYNDRVYEYSGLTPAVMLAPDGWRHVVHPDDVAKLWANRGKLPAGDGLEITYRLRRADGEYRWFERKAVPVRDEDGRLLWWLGTATDIHEQKTGAEALAALNESLEAQIEQRTAELMAAEAALRQSQKMEAVGQLTGGIAHDFNNMLQGIAGSLELMERRVGQGRTAEAEKFLAAARDGISRAAALTHQLLAFSRRQALAAKRVDVSKLVEGIAGLIQQTTGPAIAFERRIADGCWAVRCDPNQLENALLNLAINARDAMPGGGVLTVAAEPTVLDEAAVKGFGAEPGAYVRISVIDNGAGMSADVLEHAFEPFFTTKPAGQGTGLGLSQVYGFARQSNGILRLESAVGVGTTVHIYLPRDVSGEDGAGAIAASAGMTDAAGAEMPAGAARILVVEDEEEIRNFAAEVLRDLGHEVVTAAAGADALAAMRGAKEFALLVADVGLPGGLNGRQLADAARELRAGLPVLLITGYAGGSLGQSLPAGMQLLRKPFSWQQLADATAAALADG
jgi:PAS domain S-box-containing protein